MSDFAKFYALLKQLPYADKEEIVATYSGDETTSLREFLKRNPQGFGWMLADLENKVATLQRQKPQKTADESQKRKYRSRIRREMQEQGVTVKNGARSDVNALVGR